MGTASTGHVAGGAIADRRSRAPLAVALVAGDEMTSRRAGAVLAREGFDVTDAATASELAAASIRGVVDAVVLACDPQELERPDEISTLRALLPRAAIVLVCAGDDRRSIRAALGAGADGYVCEASLESALPSVVRATAAGQVCVPRAGRDVFGRPAFSYREKQVLQLVARGFTNGEIARRLYLAESTVKSHLSSSFRKLGVSSRREAAAIVLDPDSGLHLQALD